MKKPKRIRTEPMYNNMEAKLEDAYRPQVNKYGHLQVEMWFSAKVDDFTCYNAQVSLSGALKCLTQ